MKVICYLLFITLPIHSAQSSSVKTTAGQGAKPVPHYIRTVQTVRGELAELLRNHKHRSDEDKIKLSRSLRFMHHHLHTQLLQEKYEHEQFCKRLREEKKEVLRLLCKV